MKKSLLGGPETWDERDLLSSMIPNFFELQTTGSTNSLSVFETTLLCYLFYTRNIKSNLIGIQKLNNFDPAYLISSIHRLSLSHRYAKKAILVTLQLPTHTNLPRVHCWHNQNTEYIPESGGLVT